MSEPAAQRLQEIQLAVDRELQTIERTARAGAPIRLENVFSLLRTYEHFAGILYRLRSAHEPEHPTRVMAEDLFANLSHELITRKHAPRESGGYARWLVRYREIWRREFGLFFFTLALFLGSGIIGWNVAANMPAYAAVILPQQGLENILDKNPWFAQIQESPFLDGLTIAWNNIRVCFNCFLLGALCGLGGLMVLCFNGVHIGAALGFCYANGFQDQLATFIIAHGVLEISVIVASAFASLLMGRVFFMRPYRLFGVRMRRAASEAGIVVSGILPWLILAACLEVFVSPWDYLDVKARIAVGLIAGLLFWGWTFKGPLRNGRLGHFRAPRSESATNKEGSVRIST